jgi:two-component system chemotaxis response regulator CheB
MASAMTSQRGAPDGVVAVGASAGGVEALSQFAAGLPHDLRYAIMVVLHMPPDAPSVLAQIIDRSGPLPAAPATNGSRLEAGKIHVAVPGHHLLVLDHLTVLSEGPTENGHRPAINALFRSAALAFGQRAITVLLSGVLDDGVLGSAAVRSRGGTTIAQQPDDALFPAMPRKAVQAGVIDHQISAADIGGFLKQLADRKIIEREMAPDVSMELENRIALGQRFSTAIEAEELGPPSGYTCRNCNGGLMAVSDDNFRCWVGHAWTADSLLRARDAEVEGALWIAVRSLQEKANLSRKLAETTGTRGMSHRYSAMADEAEHAMSVLRERLSESYREPSEPGEVSAG